MTEPGDASGPQYVDEDQARAFGWINEEQNDASNPRRSSILGETLNLLGGGPMMIGTHKQRSATIKSVSSQVSALSTKAE